MGVKYYFNMKIASQAFHTVDENSPITLLFILTELPERFITESK